MSSAYQQIFPTNLPRSLLNFLAPTVAPFIPTCFLDCMCRYWIACAADEIIAASPSIVGSIGVLSDHGFGEVKKMRKEGRSRRIYTTGAAKGGIDEYLPVRKNQVADVHRLLNEHLALFSAAVKESRGDRLRPELAARLVYKSRARSSWVSWFSSCLGGPSKWRLRKAARNGLGLFDGSIYTGEVGRKVGLIDGIGEMRTEMQQRYGKRVRLESFEPKINLLRDFVR